MVPKLECLTEHFNAIAHSCCVNNFESSDCMLILRGLGAIGWSHSRCDALAYDVLRAVANGLTNTQLGAGAYRPLYEVVLLESTIRYA